MGQGQGAVFVGLGQVGVLHVFSQVEPRSPHGEAPAQFSLFFCPIMNDMRQEMRAWHVVMPQIQKAGESVLIRELGCERVAQETSATETRTRRSAGVKGKGS